MPLAPWLTLVPTDGTLAQVLRSIGKGCCAAVLATYDWRNAHTVERDPAALFSLNQW